MSYTTSLRGFTIRHSKEKDETFYRYNADIWTVDGWVTGSCLALDGETLDRELHAKVDELIAKGIAPGVST